jgi:hypothetical protein
MRLRTEPAEDLHEINVQVCYSDLLFIPNRCSMHQSHSEMLGREHLSTAWKDVDLQGCGPPLSKMYMSAKP